MECRDCGVGLFRVLIGWHASWIVIVSVTGSELAHRDQRLRIGRRMQCVTYGAAIIN